MKAIALVSGGLDSILAARVVKEQGIKVIPLLFRTPFALRRQSARIDVFKQQILEMLGAALEIIDIGSDFLPLLGNPPHGFGSNLNPCIDCKILMLKKSKELLARYDASFVITGEVIGQRPMSQHRRALYTIERDCGLEGLLLRPLCAKLLPPTVPEKKGWVMRDKLLSINGRTRKEQAELAKVFGLREYAHPAGGCLLTDKDFSNRLRDLMKHNELSLDNISLIKIGRYFRFSPDSKLIVGRNESENQALLAHAHPGDYLFYPADTAPGPTALGRGNFDADKVSASIAIISRYTDPARALGIPVVYRRLPEEIESFGTACPAGEKELEAIRI